MPGFRGGVFASCVLYLFRLHLPLPYLSIGDLFKRCSCHIFPVSIPSPSFVFGTCIAGVLSVPFWASSPSLSYVTFSCASSVSSLTFFSPHPVLCHSCQTMHNPLFCLSYDPTSCWPSFPWMLYACASSLTPSPSFGFLDIAMEFNIRFRSDHSLPYASSLHPFLCRPHFRLSL